MDFRASYSKRDIDGIIKSTSGPAVNSFLMSQALNAAISNNLADQSRTLSDRLVTKYPRNFYGWNVRFTLTGISEVERRYALEQIRLIDPNSAICYNSDPVTLIKQKLGALPESKQRELVRGWNLPSGLPTAQNSFSMDRDIPKLELEAKLKTFC
jgi:hypothetical protein